MKLSELRARIDAAIELWGDLPITTRDLFFSEKGPCEAEIRMQEAEVGILANMLEGAPRKWVTLDAVESPSPIAPMGEWMKGRKG